jgi:hypothetical protein
MVEKLKKGLFLILLMFLAFVATTHTVKAVEPTVKVAPSTFTATSVNQNFTLNITVQDIYSTTDHGGCWSWMVRIRWNASILKVNARADVKEGDFLKNVDPDNTKMQFYDPDNVNGRLPEVTGRFTTETEAEGSGTLVTVTFTAIGLGTTKVTVYETDFVDYDGNPIIVSTEEGTITVIPEFPMSMMLLIFLITTAAIAVVAKKRIQKSQNYIKAQ